METAEISYRVADFLKLHAPFSAVADADLLALTAQGRVRFHEPNEYILWQGEPHKAHVFVIQQGTVSLWDEAGGRADLRDVRGAGDLLGIERYTDARSCLYSARSESDVVIYAFLADDFEAHVLKYPHAVEYVSAESRVTPDYRPSGEQREPQSVFVHDVVGGSGVPTCSEQDSIAEAARRLRASASGAIAVTGGDHRPRSVLTSDTILEWVAAGGANARAPITGITQAAPAIVGPRASVTDAVLAMTTAGVDAFAITADGTRDGVWQALATPRDLASVFGEHPTALLREIRVAASLQQLRQLNNRARAFSLTFLTGATSVEWLAEFTHAVDVAVLARAGELIGVEPVGCWCVCGSSGRKESLTKLAPYLMVILDNADEVTRASGAFGSVLAALDECDYLRRADLPRPADFYVATADQWRERYLGWISDPVLQQTYQVRSLFDLRHVQGPSSPWHDLVEAVTSAVDGSFVELLAHDCLASLPPLTFFQDNVVDAVGEQSSVFHLEQSALRPLVDVGRVFGMAARQVMGRSTLERFAYARTLLPEHEAIFREASDALRIVLWQQGRVGIGLGTRGADVPPSLLSRHNRQVLKGGFRSILRLLEFTADRTWLQGL